MHISYIRKLYSEDDKSTIKIFTPMVHGMTQNSKVLQAKVTILISCCVTKRGSKDFVIFGYETSKKSYIIHRVQHR
jgi:hypothetical protein